MSTLTGLIGSQPVVSSWPNFSSADWRSPFNARLLNPGSSFSDLLNISGSSGYLLACEHLINSPQTGTARVKITVDGTVIKDMTGAIDGDDQIIVFWPPSISHLERNTITYQNSSVVPSFPLRFESSLRIQIQEVSGNVSAVTASYVLT